MKVWELIQILEGFNQELEVCIDKGDDCWPLKDYQIDQTDEEEWLVLGWEKE